MDKSEYTKKMEVINGLKQVAAKQAKDINSKADFLPDNIKGLVNVLLKRSGDFTEYLKYIKDFSFTDPGVVSSSLFPGITSSLENIDTEELQQSSEKMRQYSLNITSATKKSDYMKDQSYKVIKLLFNALADFVETEEQIYELELELLKEMDSPYDVGALASNT